MLRKFFAALVVFFLQQPAVAEEDKPDRLVVEILAHPDTRQVSVNYRFSNNLQIVGRVAEINGQRIGFTGAGPVLGKKGAGYQWEVASWFGVGFGKRFSGAAAGLSAKMEIGERLELASNLTTMGFSTDEKSTGQNQETVWQILSYGEPLGEACVKFRSFCGGVEADWTRLLGERVVGVGPELKLAFGKHITIAGAILHNTKGHNEFKTFAEFRLPARRH